ncbi:MAG: c-type cytochrome [Bacteroidia bacterium]|nr:c-type cytochrome [Bacteroidia bacterium]
MVRFNHKWKIAILLGAVALVVTSCYTDKSKRNIEYSPNMYNSLPLEPYSQTDFSGGMTGGHYAATGNSGPMNPIFADGLNAQKAPAGTIPREESWIRPEAYIPYPFTNTPEGKDSARQFWTSPLNDVAMNEKGYECTEKTYLTGKTVYETFCIMCHGTNGDGQGNLVTSGKFGAVPDYRDSVRAALSEGEMFHSITHGKGVMGSYASQVTPMQRWQVICYIRKFQEQ